MYISEQYLNEFRPRLWGTKQAIKAKQKRKDAKVLLDKDKNSELGKKLEAEGKEEGKKALMKKGFTIAATVGAIDAAVNKDK